MPFEKGNKLGKGRPKGSKNSNNIKDLLKDFLEFNIPNLQKYFDGLEDSQKVKAILDLMPYYVPKRKSIEVIEEEKVEEEPLTDEQVRIIAEELNRRY